MGTPIPDWYYVIIMTFFFWILFTTCRGAQASLEFEDIHISTDVVYENQDIIVNGNISIVDNGSLHLLNSNVYFNTTCLSPVPNESLRDYPDAIHIIDIGENAKIIAENSLINAMVSIPNEWNITNLGEASPFALKINGILIATNTTFVGMGKQKLFRYSKYSITDKWLLFHQMSSSLHVSNGTVIMNNCIMSVHDFGLSVTLDNSSFTMDNVTAVEETPFYNPEYFDIYGVNSNVKVNNSSLLWGELDFTNSNIIVQNSILRYFTRDYLKFFSEPRQFVDDVPDFIFENVTFIPVLGSIHAKWEGYSGFSDWRFFRTNVRISDLLLCDNINVENHERFYGYIRFWFINSSGDINHIRNNFSYIPRQDFSIRGDDYSNLIITNSSITDNHTYNPGKVFRESNHSNITLYNVTVEDFTPSNIFLENSIFDCQKLVIIYVVDSGGLPVREAPIHGYDSNGKLSFEGISDNQGQYNVTLSWLRITWNLTNRDVQQEYSTRFRMDVSKDELFNWTNLDLNESVIYLIILEPLPDLKGSVVLYSYSVLSGQSSMIGVAVTNNGTDFAYNVTLLLEIDNEIFDEKLIQFILQGETVFIDFEWIPDKEGDIVITAYVDPYLINSDVDWSNNEDSTSIQVVRKAKESADTNLSWNSIVILSFVFSFIHGLFLFQRDEG
jgi:hypothetical protein